MTTSWNFDETTQRQNWMYDSVEELMKFRREANEREQNTHQITATNRITVEDEMKLKNYYQSKIIDSCNTLNYSRRVQATAIVYFKRFFLRNSILSYDPKLVMLTCIYIACKTEEHRRAVEEIAGAGKTDATTIINTEITVLAGLSFHLVLIHPYRSLVGFLEEIKRVEFGLDWISVDSEAQTWVTQSLLTDSVFIFSPAQIALASLWKATETRTEHRMAFLRFLNSILGNDPRFEELKAIISEKLQPFLDANEAVETKQAATIDRKMRSSPANQYQQVQRKKKKKKSTSSTSSYGGKSKGKANDQAVAMDIEPSSTFPTSSTSSSSSSSTLHALPPSVLASPPSSKV